MTTRIEKFGKQKKNKSLTGLRLILLIIFAAIFAFCGFMIISYLIDGYKSEQLIDSIREQIPAAAPVSQNTNVAGSPSAAGSSASVSTDAASMAQYQSLLQINPHAVGWITISGMNIDYPVARAEDNAYYLNRNFAQQQSSHGSLFMDYRNAGDAKDTHIIIYGHNMRDGSMFGQLSQYKDASFFKTHQSITINLRGVATVWQIFSVSTVDVQALPVVFENNAEFAGYIQALKVGSLYNTGVSVGPGDQIITLSTCSHDYDNSRFVVHAKRLSAAQ